MRILIVPNYPHPYDQRMAEGLARGFRELGYEARSLPSPINDSLAATICGRLDTDVLLQINRFRPTSPPLPDKVRHIAWFQDVFPDTVSDVKDRCRSGDIVYALGDLNVLGLNVTLPCYAGSLLTGVEKNIEPLAPNDADCIDFSLCGFIPPPQDQKSKLREDSLWYIRDSLFRLPLIGRNLAWRVFWHVLLRNRLPSHHVPVAMSSAFRSITESLYQPLQGDLDIHALSEAMQMFRKGSLPPDTKKQRSKPTSKRSNSRLSQILSVYNLGSLASSTQPEIDAIINYLAREYPRLLDRQLLIRRALNVSKSLHLYGDGWAMHKEFAPYFKGVLSSQNELLEVYSRSRINLMNNTHGLGLHSRTLECMAVGGFIFTHRSPHDAKPGGIETSFEAGVHYGVYTPETIEDEARRWLADDEARKRAGLAAAAIINQKHLWRHRAEQILADMKR